MTAPEMLNALGGPAYHIPEGEQRQRYTGKLVQLAERLLDAELAKPDASTFVATTVETDPVTPKSTGKVFRMAIDSADFMALLERFDRLEINHGNTLGSLDARLAELSNRTVALEDGHSGPAQLVPNHEKRLDALEASTALEELRHLVEALKQTTARLDLVATRHDERLATLERERGVRLLTALEAEKERLRGEVSGVSPLHAASRKGLPTREHDPLHSFDAQVWAREFMRLFSGFTVGRDDLDEGLMLSWFANALMRGFDEYRWKHEPERKLDEAYNERNRLVALLARIYPSGIRKTAIEGWDPCWHGCVFVDTPMGQMSWHYHDRDADLFAGLPPYTKDWDGHSTPEKYERLAQLTRSYWARTPEPAGVTTGIGESWREGYREALNEAFREGRRRERASLIGHGDGVTVIIRDYPALIGDVVSGCKALRATRVLVDAAGPVASVLRHLEQAGLPAEALPKGVGLE